MASRIGRVAMVGILLGGVLSTSCSGGGAEPGTAAAAAEPAAQGAAAEDDLPAGHPPVTTDSGFTLPEVPSESGTGSSGLTWQPPATWIAEAPANAMRKAQYRVEGEGGSAECVVFYFGPGQGGDAMSNAERWAGQFSQPDGRSPLEALRTEQIEVDGIPVLLVEIAGTYGGGMAMMGGSARNLDNHMLLGAVAEGPDANWFFKLTGPAATVGAQRDAFEAMIRSLRQGG